MAHTRYNVCVFFTLSRNISYHVDKRKSHPGQFLFQSYIIVSTIDCACCLLIGIVQAVDIGDCLLNGMEWNCVNNGFLIIAMNFFQLRKIDLGNWQLIGIVHTTNDFRGCPQICHSTKPDASESFGKKVGTQLSKAQVRLENKAGTRLVFNLSKKFPLRQAQLTYFRTQYRTAIHVCSPHHLLFFSF